MQAAGGYQHPGLLAGGAYPNMAAGAFGVGAGAATAAEYNRMERREQGMDSDEVPLTREVDDFSRGFNDALGRIGEDTTNDFADYRNATAAANGAMANTGVSNTGNSLATPPDQAAGASSGDPARPLWQQDRRQSRNLMWM